MSEELETVTIGVSGTRHPGVNALPMITLLTAVMGHRPANYRIVTGDATGIDAAVIEFAKERHIPVTSHKADWKTYRKAAGPKRNKLIVDECDWLAAFPLKGAENRGTSDAIRQAKKAKKPIIMVEVVELA